MSILVKQNVFLSSNFQKNKNSDDVKNNLNKSQDFGKGLLSQSIMFPVGIQSNSMSKKRKKEGQIAQSYTH